MKSKQIPISIAARLIYHLGEQLISDELVALLELIKNSYDADATRCVVRVDSTAQTPHGLGMITIQDNGNGMLPHVVENDFLRLATDYKKINKVSPYYKRRTLGEKGLGRLSYQRLGRFVQVRTVPRIDRLREFLTPDDEQALLAEGLNCFDITMDWDGFSDSEDISHVFATVTARNEQSCRPGTLITIQGIRNIGFWELGVEKRRRLQDEILALINPFAETKNAAAFNLELDVNGEKFFIDSVDETVVDKLSDVSSHFAFDGHVLTLTAEFKKKYIDRQKEEYIKRWEKEGFSVVKDKFDPAPFENREFKVQLDRELSWEKDCQLPPHTVALINGIPATNFVFDGSLYVVDKAVANKTNIDENILRQSLFVQKSFQRIGALWDRISGVYMYRDQFRILPYGKNDWLDFTTRSQKRKATILKQGNVSGYVHLNGEKSEAIREQTNRQGILEDEYGSNFLLILNQIIVQKLFEWDVEIRRVFTIPKQDRQSDLYWNADKTISFQRYKMADEIYQEESKKLEEAIEQSQQEPRQVSFYEAETVKNDFDRLADHAKTFKRASLELQRDYQQKLSLAHAKLSEYSEILPMLGQTLIIETVTHELSRIYSNLAQSVNDLSRITNNTQPPNDQLAKIAFQLREEIAGLDLQLNHIMPTQRYKLKDVQEVELASFLAKQYVQESAVTKRFEREEIACHIQGESFKISASIGNLIVIFDNLVMNSEYWLDKSGIQSKHIYFECGPDRTVHIWDSGLGVAKEIENTLFEPFQTMKRDGRGLGLYIVQELLALMGAAIELLPERNRHGNRYKFEIVFQEKKK